MFLPALLLFLLFLLLSALFSSSETAYVGSSSYRINSLVKKGSRKAKLVKKMRQRMDHLLATILVGNTLVNTAAASVATFIFVSFMPENKDQAVLLATLTTTVLILILSEITPKTYAAHNPIKLSFLYAHVIRFFEVVFYPFVKTFTFFTRLIYPPKKATAESSSLDEEEMRVLLTMGVKGMSSIRSRMISGVLDIGTRPIREIMIPRTQVKAVEMNEPLEQIIQLIQEAGFSRFPVFKDRLDNIQGVIHAKDIISYLTERKEFKLEEITMRPYFVPEYASLEKVLLDMQKQVHHMVFVVDEFGNMEGIVTLEDIIEEIVGEIQDESDVKVEDRIIPVKDKIYRVKGYTPIKEVNQRIPLGLPETLEYTTLAGFFLHEYGRIPKEGKVMEYEGNRFIVEKMTKRRINSIRIELQSNEEPP